MAVCISFVQLYWKKFQSWEGMKNVLVIAWLIYKLRIVICLILLLKQKVTKQQHAKLLNIEELQINFSVNKFPSDRVKDIFLS